MIIHIGKMDLVMRIHRWVEPLSILSVRCFLCVLIEDH